MSRRDSAVSLTQKFERAQRLAQLGTWEWDIATQSFSCSEQFARIVFGNQSHASAPSPASILGRVHPHDRADLVTRADEARRTHHPFDFECRIVRPDSEIRCARVRGETVRNEVGVPVQICGIAQDVTAREEARTATASAAAELSAIVRAMGDVVLVLDCDGRYRRIETTAAPLLYRPSDELLGKRMHEVLPTEAADIFLGHIRRAIDTGLTEYVEYSLPISDELVWFSGAISPLSPTEVVWVARDISQRKRQEEELERAKEAAELANRAKSAFLSRVSHELRTPLNAILGFAQMLEQDVQKSEECEGVDHILRAGQHLLGVIDDLLDISSIEQGRISLSLEAIPVKETLTSTLALVRHMAEQNAVSLDIDQPLAHADWHVRADPQRLRQVLTKLLSNAINYNRHGGRVTISVHLAGADMVRITVADTGYGIPADQLPRLFTPFDRLDAERRNIRGVGLSLALSNALVTAMGGQLEVESTVDEGSRFSIVLARTEPLVASDTDPGGNDAPATPPGQRRTVLYIEDHPANLTLVERLLRRRPHVRLLLAMNGEIGLELAAQHRPDLLLLDRNLPDMTGDEILRRVRHDPALLHMPVVVISGDALPEHIARLREQGADAYLTKPFDIVEFLQVLDHYLDAAR